MARFLTPEWVTALDDAARLLRYGAERPTTIEYVVGSFTYHVLLAEDRVRFRVGAADGFDVRFTTEPETATAIARGTLSAQRAFMNGLLPLEGDPLALERSLPALRLLADAFAAVRSTTEW